MVESEIREGDYDAETRDCAPSEGNLFDRKRLRRAMEEEGRNLGARA